MRAKFDLTMAVKLASTYAPLSFTTLMDLCINTKSCRLISTTTSLDKRYKGGCTKWKRGGLIQTSIYTGFKGQAPVPKPMFDYKSGDRKLEYEKPLPYDIQPYFKDVPLDNLDPQVRRILSAELADARKAKLFKYDSLLDKVRRHPGDNDSLEVQIVEQTINLKKLFEMVKQRKWERKLNHATRTVVKARYENLMKLRRSDHDRFVWLCEMLEIDFILKPDIEVELNEKEKVLYDAQKEADLLKEDKVNEYRKFLATERELFEKRKRETIEKLEKELAQFGFNKADYALPGKDLS